MTDDLDRFIARLRTACRFAVPPSLATAGTALFVGKPLWLAGAGLIAAAAFMAFDVVFTPRT